MYLIQLKIFDDKRRKKTLKNNKKNIEKYKKLISFVKNEFDHKTFKYLFGKTKKQAIEYATQQIQNIKEQTNV